MAIRAIVRDQVRLVLQLGLGLGSGLAYMSEPSPCAESDVAH